MVRMIKSKDLMLQQLLHVHLGYLAMKHMRMPVLEDVPDRAKWAVNALVWEKNIINGLVLRNLDRMKI